MTARLNYYLKALENEGGICFRFNMRLDLFTGLILLFWAWLLTNGRGPKGSRPLVRAKPKKVGLKQFIAQNYNDRLHKALESILGPLN